MLDVMSADIIFFLLFDRFIINSCQFEVFTGEYRPNMGRMEQIFLGEGIFLKHVEGGGGGVQRDFSTSQVKSFLHTFPVTIAASLYGWFRAFSFVLKNLKRYSPKEEKMSKESTGSTKSPREVCPPQGIKAGMSVFFNKQLK